MAQTIKDHSLTEIKLSEPSITSDFEEESWQERRIPFFGSRFQRKENNTWVISFFVVLQLVAFAATMFINNCWRNSHGDCVMKSLGRFSFQPLSENPLLGPSSSTLDEMGALRWTLVVQQHQIWRLLTCIWLHAGVIHLIINLSSIIFIGILLEQEYGTLRIGIIYTLSALIGSLVAALFVRDSPVVGSSGALFGLLGAMISGIIQNWTIYTNKVAALVALSLITLINFFLGLLPHVDNFSNIGGFLSGLFLGFVLLFNPQMGKVPQNKRGLFEYNVNHSMACKHKLDKPVLRSVSLVLFSLLLAGGLVAVLHGVDANKYCSWCHFINCVPSKSWNCNDKAIPCEVMVNAERLTLTCKSNDKFQIYPFTNISQARIGDLCSQICS